MRIRNTFRRVKYGQKPVTQADVQHTSGGIQLKHQSQLMVLPWAAFFIYIGGHYDST